MCIWHFGGCHKWYYFLFIGCFVLRQRMSQEVGCVNSSAAATTVQVAIRACTLRCTRLRNDTNLHHRQCGAWAGAIVLTIHNLSNQIVNHDLCHPWHVYTVIHRYPNLAACLNASECRVTACVIVKTKPRRLWSLVSHARLSKTEYCWSDSLLQCYCLGLDPLSQQQILTSLTLTVSVPLYYYL